MTRRTSKCLDIRLKVFDQGCNEYFIAINTVCINDTANLAIAITIECSKYTL